MDQKRCVTCHELRLLSDFNRRRSASDGLQARCRQCCRDWYERNKEQHKANVLRRNNEVRAANKRRMGAYLLEHPCVDCGEGDPRVLEFDHIGEVPKRADVGRLLGSALPWARVLEEISACVVRCANCHRRVTSERAGDWRARFVADRGQDEAARAADRLARLLG